MHNEVLVFYGWLSGIFTLVLLMLFLVHMGESTCQEKNNVYDCSLTLGMTPVEVIDE